MTRRVLVGTLVLVVISLSITAFRVLRNVGQAAEATVEFVDDARVVAGAARDTLAARADEIRESETAESVGELADDVFSLTKQFVDRVAEALPDSICGMNLPDHDRGVVVPCVPTDST